MSFPSIPNITPTIKITTEESVNLLLASIALEEMGLAHIINAEAEKIQFILGTLPDHSLPDQPTEDTILAVNKSVEQLLQTVIKSQMLLQFKLENVLSISTTSSTTTTSTTTTTTTTKTTTSSSTSTTTTKSSTTTTKTHTTTTKTHTTTTKTCTTMTKTCPPCAPCLTYAVFANNNFYISSKSAVSANTQVNGDLTITHGGNNFLGITNVVGNFADSGDNIYAKLVLDVQPVSFKKFDAACLKASADLVIDRDVIINSAADAAKFQGKTVWVNGSVTINGSNISIIGGGILAKNGIAVYGGYFTYTSTECFALYSQTGDITISNVLYSITGLIYTASTHGDIILSSSQGGCICGAVISGGDVIFTGGRAIHEITNTCTCNPCLLCNSLCPEL